MYKGVCTALLTRAKSDGTTSPATTFHPPFAIKPILQTNRGYIRNQKRPYCSVI